MLFDSKSPVAFLKTLKNLPMKNLLILIPLLLSILLVTSCNDELIDSTDSINSTDIHTESKRNCGTHDHMSKLMEDPNYVKNYELKMSAFKKMNAERKEKAACTSPTIVPVAVHYQGVSSPNRNCLVNLAQSQIDILNADYSGQNSDISKWTNDASSYFPGISHGEACIQFVLANTNHPNGFSLQNGDPAITINQTNGDQANQWSGYLNIFVQFDTGLLGYSPLGGSGNGDGVVIDANAFGAGSGCGSVTPDAPYNLGRTLTHELGHYFLLDHIWGNGCAQDDEVNDTPDQSSDYGGCPNTGVQSCGSVDMHMNYMDYTNDACMYMFSAGQAQRMENYLSSNLNNLINNAANVIDGQPSTGGGDTGGEDTGGETDNGGDTGGEEEPEEPASCMTPENSTVNAASKSSVTIDWADIPQAIRYRVRFRIIGTTNWTAKNSTSSTKTLVGLLSGETYEYQLRTRCPQGWTTFSPKQTFSVDQDTDGGTDEETSSNLYTLKITLDDYGSETTWYILNQNYDVLYSGGPYQDGQSGTVITQEVDLSSGCFELELQDDYGDGICCEYGNGSAEIIDANGRVVTYLDGNFGTFDYIGFCVDGNGLRVTKQNRDGKKKNRAKKK